MSTQHQELSPPAAASLRIRPPPSLPPRCAGFSLRDESSSRAALISLEREQSVVASRLSETTLSLRKRRSPEITSNREIGSRSFSDLSERLAPLRGHPIVRRFVYRSSAAETEFIFTRASTLGLINRIP